MSGRLNWEREAYRRRRDTRIAEGRSHPRKPPVEHVASELHPQPCTICTGRVRPGDTYVNRQHGGTWQPIHKFCLT